jgi:hypothetical protein
MNKLISDYVSLMELISIQKETGLIEIVPAGWLESV